MESQWICVLKYILIKCFHIQKYLYCVKISVKTEADEETFNEPLTWWLTWWLATKSIAETFAFDICYELF